MMGRAAQPRLRKYRRRHFTGDTTDSMKWKILRTLGSKNSRKKVVMMKKAQHNNSLSFRFLHLFLNLTRCSQVARG